MFYLGSRKKAWDRTSNVLIFTYILGNSPLSLIEIKNMLPDASAPSVAVILCQRKVRMSPVSAK
jgi:hypothetical protein